MNIYPKRLEKQLKMINILVTGVGAIIGYGIAKSLKTQKKYAVRVIGMDIYPDAYGQFICDKFYQAELAYSDEYPAFVQKVVRDENIDLIIPGIEQDMYRLNQISHMIPCKIVLNNQLLIDISKDKLATYNYFKDKEINLIPTLFKAGFDTCQEALGLPFLLKPRASYASKGIHKIMNKEEFAFFNKDPEANICQRIVGTNEDEYTISVFGMGDGTFADYIILRRKLSQTGATDKASVVLEEESIMSYVSRICEMTKPIGPTNIQIRKEYGNVLLLEINPRISSACSIRCAAGYNEPLMCIEYYLMNEKPSSSKKREIKAVRYISDYIYE